MNTAFVQGGVHNRDIGGRLTLLQWKDTQRVYRVLVDQLFFGNRRRLNNK